MASEKLPIDLGEYTAVSFLFGHPISHSVSPLLHQTVYDALGKKWAQIPFPCTEMEMEQLLPLLQLKEFYGASVTMPLKIVIMQHLDYLTVEARDVGACNTIFVREKDGKRLLCGTNTDVVGVRESFFQNVQDRTTFSGHPGMVVGGGGAARSAVYALQRWLRCDPIYLVNRDAQEVETLIDERRGQTDLGRLIHVATVPQAERLLGAKAVVSCVPDCAPLTEPEIRSRHITEILLNKSVEGTLLEMCYHPTPWTAIAKMALQRGWKVILGIEAVIWQGLEQDRYWTGLSLEQLPVQRVKKALNSTLLDSKL